MKFKIVSKGGYTAISNVETGEALPVTSLRFEHASPEELPTLTLTLHCLDKIEVDAEMTVDGPATLNPILRDGKPAIEMMAKSVADADDQPALDVEAKVAGSWLNRETLL